MEFFETGEDMITFGFEVFLKSNLTMTTQWGLVRPLRCDQPFPFGREAGPTKGSRPIEA